MGDLGSQDQAIVAVGYVRVSTEEQVREGYSLDEQKREIRAYAERHGWRLARIYADEGLSGRSADRPDFRRMLDDAGSGSFQRAIAWKLDRLGRSTGLVLDSLGALDAAGVEFVSLRENLDTSSPAGRYMRTNLAAIAEMEAEMIAERSRTGIAGRKRDGRRGGGPPPYGFDYTRDRDDPTDKGTLSENPLEAAIVREIYRLCLDGFGISKIVRHLRDRNERTKRGAQWSQYQVGFILKSPLYVGYLDIDPEGEPIKARHDPIVSHDDWLAVRAIRQARRDASGRGRGRTTLTPHLLTRGLGRCGRCGAALVPRGQRYVCRSRHHYGSCDLPTIPRQQMDQPLLDEFERRILDLDTTRERIQQAASQVRDEALAQRERAERDVANAEAAIDKPTEPSARDGQKTDRGDHRRRSRSRRSAGRTQPPQQQHGRDRGRAHRRRAVETNARREPQDAPGARRCRRTPRLRPSPSKRSERR